MKRLWKTEPAEPTKVHCPFCQAVVTAYRKWLSSTAQDSGKARA